MLSALSAQGQPPAQPEARVDPEDGRPRTLEELKQLCSGRYSDKEIEDYWNEQCVPQASEAAAGIANDPFLTSQARVPRPPSQAASQSGPLPSLRSLPPSGAPGSSPHSLGGASPRPAGPPPSQPPGGAYHEEIDVSKDPFMTLVDKRRPPSATFVSPAAGYSADGTLRARRQQELSTGAAPKRRWGASCLDLLGPGDPDRDTSTRPWHIFAPWAVFVSVLLMWVILQHYSFHATMVFTIALGVCFSGVVSVWAVGADRGAGAAPSLGLGLLPLLAVASGVGVGQVGWDRLWRQYWWTQTGHRTGLTSASTPAGARTDFAVVNFWDAQAEGTVNNTRVDHLKSAGYKDGHLYCAAPILSPETAGVSLVLVNYWAIGIDCCQQLGSFTCDASREHQGGYGVVMLEGGLPCPGCSGDNFRSAVAKAEAMHRLVSARDAVFVRWVQNPTSLQMAMLGWALLYVAVSSLLGLVVFATLGWLTWYRGVGKPPPGLPDAGPRKQVD